MDGLTSEPFSSHRANSELFDALLIWKAYRPMPELAPTCQAERETVSDLRSKP